MSPSTKRTYTITRTEPSLSTFPGGAEAQPTACPEATQPAPARLGALLAAQAARYTQGDSTSLPVEVVQELLTSLLYTLGQCQEKGEAPLSLDTLPDIPLEDALRQGQQALWKKQDMARQLWRLASLRRPHIPSQALEDTLADISGFWTRYDHRLFAHQLPCDIDYPLCHPVSEALLGVDYLLAYLGSLCLEHDFLRRFDAQVCIRLLHRYCPDYRGQIINLYLPIATNALGLSLLGMDVLPLRLTPAQQGQLLHLLAPLTQAAVLQKMERAVEDVCYQLALQPGPASHYLAALTQDLWPRLQAALTAGSLKEVFLTF